MSDSAGNGTVTFHEVSTEHPCPRCGKTSWCRVRNDGASCVCRRIAEGGVEKTDKNGDLYYLHRLIEHPPNSNGHARPTPQFSLADGGRVRADPDTLNNIYTALLNKLPLLQTHVKALEDRGLLPVAGAASYAAAYPEGYRTLGIGRIAAVSSLIKAGMESTFPRVPGLVVRDKDGRRYWSLIGRGGLLIPVRDLERRIVALSVRLDAPGPEGPKYHWLSSKKHGGAGPGSPIHVPLFQGDTTTIRITEGALKADAATRLSGTLTIGLPGVNAWKRAARLARRLNAQTVLIAFDADARTNRHVATALARLVKHLQAEGFTVVLESWPPSAGKGIDDLLSRGGTPERITGDAVAPAVVAIVSAAEEANPAPPRSAPDTADLSRERVVLGADEHRVEDETIRALAARDSTLFQRGGKLVRVVRDSRPQKARLLRRPARSPQIGLVPLPNLRTRLTRVVEFVRVDGQGAYQPQHPPDWLVKAIDAAADWPGVRHLEAVTETPVLRADGTVLQQPGYDPETGVLYEPSGEFPEVPARPTTEQVEQARDALLEVVCDFPFRAQAHRAAWVAAVLTAPARFAFDGPSPLFLIEANIRGAGKGKLAAPISLVATGREFAVSTYTDEERETRKSLTAIALQGDRLVLFDNVTGDMGDGALAAALTTTEWAGRILGKSEQPRLPLLVTWVATGNNVNLVADLPRRTLRIRIESPDEKPEERRDFRHPDLEAWVRQERRRLLVAALTMLTGYIAAGRPDMGLPAWGSYEGWSALIRSTVVWSGLPDPYAAREVYNRADSETNLLQSFLAGWEEADASNGATVAHVLEQLKANPNDFPLLREALSEAFSLKPGDLPGSKAIAKKLMAWEGRNVGGRCFVGTPGQGGITRWSIRPVGGNPGAGGLGGFGGFVIPPPRGARDVPHSPVQEGWQNKPTKPTKPTRALSGEASAFDDVPEVRPNDTELL
jgi:hypothetical protein